MSEQPNSHSTHDSEQDHRNQSIKIFLNGQIVPRNEAVVSVYDSGFMLGDGMWEGLRLYNGVWAFFDEHMDRLFNSCKSVSIDIGMTKDEVLEALNATAKANGMTSDAHCRLMITRGTKDKPFQTSRPVALWSDGRCDPRTFKTGKQPFTTGHPPCDCTTSAWPADEPRCQNITVTPS